MIAYPKKEVNQSRKGKETTAKKTKNTMSHAVKKGKEEQSNELY